MKKLKYLILFFTFLNATLISGQTFNDSLKVISSSLLKKDFLIFKDSLFKIHPDLYRFIEKKKIDQLLDSCYLSLNKDETEFEFCANIKYVLGSIQDAHLFSWVSDKGDTFYKENVLLFPIQLRFIKDKAYIFCSSNNVLIKGTQIIAINDKSIDKIKDELFEYIPSDGAIVSNKYRELSNYFSFYYFMLYGQQSSFIVSFKSINGNTNSITIKSEYYKNIICENKIETQEKHLKLAYYNNDSIALLTINSFSYDELTNSKEDLPIFLESTFKELKNKKTNNLIIDLRENAGGRDVYGALLYSYLTNQDFKYYESLNTINQQLRGVDHPNLLVQHPQINNFIGQVNFLIDGLSFSTASEFCSIAKSQNRGLFIGEETGGGYYGDNSGSFVVTTLPYSKVIIYIPTTKYVMAVKPSKYDNRGILPDFEIIPTISDIIQQNDVQLNFALNLTRQK